MSKYSQQITLDSAGVDYATDMIGSYGDFTVFYNRPTVLPDDSKICLVNSSIWYTWAIISEKFNNNKFAISDNNGTSFITYTIEDGNYTFKALNSLIANILVANYGQDPADLAIQLLGNTSTSKTTIYIKDSSGYQIDLGINLFYKIIGLSDIQNKIIIETTKAEQLTNITFDINSYQIHCSLIDSSIFNSSLSSDILHTFVPGLPSGYNLPIEPPEKIYIPIRQNKTMTDIRIYLTDNLGRPVDLREPMSILLHIKN